ncbi:uncharacterized protein [Macrobrachium rosenbergii]|uniref:uncharacterized protein n=1 Tax=Macrobrachium rosenbergii TaxID=79674 RepID=UPI0034D3AD7D
MVHKKSTYRLMFKNYDSEVRKTVWEENNSLRLRRREEERSHHKIEEDNSCCDCDSSDEEIIRPPKTLMKNVSVQSQPETFHQEVSVAQSDQKKVLPSVPRLHFSPDDSPRQQKEAVHYESDTKDTKEDLNPQYLMPTSDPEQSEPKDLSRNGRQLGVMRSRSQEREYDLIPVSKESEVRPRSASSSKAKLVRSHRYPYTSQLSRTLRKNFHDGDKKIIYLPVGSGQVVRSIGDQTSFNVHLNKEQVRSTALQASAQRNREIENLIKRQRKINLEDWREKNKVEHINNSSIFLEDDKNIFSRSRPKEKLYDDQHRVRVFSNFCKHCGGRK